MPKIGVRKPFAALYEFNGSQVTYSGGHLIAKAAEFSTTMNNSSDNDFYADDGVSETDKEFSDGTGTLTVDDLLQEARKFVYGLTQTEYTDKAEKSVKINRYNADMQIPYLGFGVIIKVRNNKKTMWRAVILNKIQFSVPSESVQTQNKTINWQTTPLPFTIMRDDTNAAEWMQDGYFDTEDAAFTWIKSVLTPEEP